MSTEVYNSFVAKMRQGGIASTLSVRLVTSNEIAGYAKAAGYDGILIDMEHSSMDIPTATQLCIAALYANIAPIVRVPENSTTYISRALDGGALGIIIPHIRCVADAQKAVDACKFQPVGTRSATGGLPQFNFQSLPRAVAADAANAATVVIPMIETPEALELVDEIAALEGVDSLLIGTSDLSAELGIPGDFDHVRIAEAYEKTIAACNRHGKLVGVGGLNARLDLVEKFCTMGASWVMAGADNAMLMAASKKRAQEMRELEKRALLERPKSGPSKMTNGHA
ncbi:hypothetical protein PRZ48_002845 [Zasmidium cellare]|uniref:HpcH/HpaI aldolase/citrate lyase domain-containing protein n=1 Tax=Zasmidium cellare TaxID=395010 RepID=A0ABR0ETJ5_ZASCE|nr:hypothetical protein PRZ48_002845 [Zasmidium cellare]